MVMKKKKEEIRNWVKEGTAVYWVCLAVIDRSVVKFTMDELYRTIIKQYPETRRTLKRSQLGGLYKPLSSPLRAMAKEDFKDPTGRFHYTRLPDAKMPIVHPLKKEEENEEPIVQEEPKENVKENAFVHTSGFDTVVQKPQPIPDTISFSIVIGTAELTNLVRRMKEVFDTLTE